MRIASRVALGALLLASACGEPTSDGRAHPATMTGVSGSGQAGVVGQAIAAPLVVEVRDKFGVPAPDIRVNFRFVSGSGSFSTPSVETGIDGRASTLATLSLTGTARVVASVYSSSLSVPFLLSASGPAPPLCTLATTMRLAPAQIETAVGGDQACFGGSDAGASYALIAFNADTTVGATQAIELSVTGAVSASLAADNIAARAAVRSPRVATRRPLPAAMRPPQWPALTDQEGEIREFNLNLSDACTNALVRGARIVRVSQTAVAAVDTANPANGWTDAELRAIAADFDTIYHPSTVLNFLPPDDLDTNGRVILLFTRAVNETASPSVSHATAAFRVRDLQPRVPRPRRPAPCPTSNQAEILYVAVPGVSGRTKAAIQLQLPRALAHSYQHLINASRRLYVNGATQLEEPWLDEALSQIAEELLWQRVSTFGSRLNLDPFDVGVSPTSVFAFEYQRGNLDNYAAFLQAPNGVTPLFVQDSPAARGAAWSLIRYLVDRRQGIDYEAWTKLDNSVPTGLHNLVALTGPTLPDQMRDWAISVLVDDWFEVSNAFRQPSWNFRALYPENGYADFPLRIPTLAAGTTSLTIPAGGVAYFRLNVPAGSAAAARWSGANGAVAPPLVEWSLVRLN